MAGKVASIIILMLNRRHSHCWFAIPLNIVYIWVFCHSRTCEIYIHASYIYSWTRILTGLARHNINHPSGYVIGISENDKLWEPSSIVLPYYTWTEVRPSVMRMESRKCFQTNAELRHDRMRLQPLPIEIEVDSQKMEGRITNCYLIYELNGNNIFFQLFSSTNFLSMNRMVRNCLLMIFPRVSSAFPCTYIFFSQEFD